MPTKMRLQRKGKKGQPFYHIVIADGRAPRDGKYIERIGTYNPLTKPADINLDFDRALHWLQVGAQPTDTVRNILSYTGILFKNHLAKGVTKGALTQEQADAKFDAWLKDKEAKIAGKVDETEQEQKSETKKRLEAERKVNDARAKEIAARRLAELKEEMGDAEEAPEEGAESTDEAVAEVPVEEKAEAPVEEPKVEEPKAEAPVEEPKVEKPKAEAPAEEPKAEDVKVEAPAEEPKAKEVKAEAPVEEPKAEVKEEKVEEPAPEVKKEKVEAPIVEEAKTPEVKEEKEEIKEDAKEEKAEATKEVKEEEKKKDDEKKAE